MGIAGMHHMQSADILLAASMHGHGSSSAFHLCSLLNYEGGLRCVGMLLNTLLAPM